MIEIRFHGRGGQGAVTAADLLAQAAIAEDKYAQGFPNFGPERRGAPVTAFFRVSETPIYLREKIKNPDMVVVLDDTLLDMVDVCEGMRPGGILVVNTSEARREKLMDYTQKYTLACVDADRIAMDKLGVPISNTAIIGALIKAKGFVEMASLEEPLKERFGRLAEKNTAAMQAAHDQTKVFPISDSAVLDNASGETEETDYQALLKKEALAPWDQTPLGCDITTPGSSAGFLTGNWRTSGRPVTDYEKCIKCGFCWILCPDTAYRENADGTYAWNGDYCKGCGICVVECPKGAIVMQEES